jgi:hypothetical protein
MPIGAKLPGNPPVKLPPPVTGESAVPSTDENAPPPACKTLDVCALRETRTAIIATPIIAIKTVTIEVTIESLIENSPYPKMIGPLGPEPIPPDGKPTFTLPPGPPIEIPPGPTPIPTPLEPDPPLT